MDIEQFYDYILNGDISTEDIISELQNGNSDCIIAFNIQREEIINIQYLLMVLSEFLSKTENLPVFTEVAFIPPKIIKRKKNIDNIFIKIQNKRAKVISINGMNFDEFCWHHLMCNNEYNRAVFIESIEDCPLNLESEGRIYHLKGQIDYDESTPYFRGAIFNIIE